MKERGVGGGDGQGAESLGEFRHFIGSITMVLFTLPTSICITGSIDSRLRKNKLDSFSTVIASMDICSFLPMPSSSAKCL